MTEKQLPALHKSVRLLDEYVEETPDEVLAMRIGQALTLLHSNDKPIQNVMEYFTRVGLIMSAINDIEEASTRSSFREDKPND